MKNATEVVTELYRKFPKVEFIDERDLGNDIVGLMFEYRNKEVDEEQLKAYLDSIGNWYRIRESREFYGGKSLLVKAEDDYITLPVEDDLSVDWYYKHRDDYDPYGEPKPDYLLGEAVEGERAFMIRKGVLPDGTDSMLFIVSPSNRLCIVNGKEGVNDPTNTEPLYMQGEKATVGGWEEELDKDTIVSLYLHQDGIVLDDADEEIDTEEDPTEGRFKYIASKSVMDSDGFYTDYTWYFDKEEGKHVFVFGDTDMYYPEDGDYDWEVEGDDERAQEEAQEWFDSYDGIFDESEFDESLKESKSLKEDDEEQKIKIGDRTFFLSSRYTYQDGAMLYHSQAYPQGRPEKRRPYRVSPKYNMYVDSFRGQAYPTSTVYIADKETGKVYEGRVDLIMGVRDDYAKIVDWMRNGGHLDPEPKFEIDYDILPDESLIEAKSKKSKEKHIDPYTMEDVDVYEYKGYEIDDTANGFVLFYCGDDCYFDSLEDAEAFIDSELNESLKEAKSEIPEKASLKEDNQMSFSVGNVESVMDSINKFADKHNYKVKVKDMDYGCVVVGGKGTYFGERDREELEDTIKENGVEASVELCDEVSSTNDLDYVTMTIVFDKSGGIGINEDYCDMFGCEGGYFTRDDLNELMYEINDRCPKGMQATAIYMGDDEKTLEVDMEDDEYGSETVYKKIDMRKIRKPSDLLRYANSIIADFQNTVGKWEVGNEE